LGGKVSRLDLTTQFTGKDGQPISFEGVGYYRAIDDKVFDGFWVDSSGDIEPLNATLGDQTLTVIWGTEETALGRSIYQLLPDNTLVAVNSLKTAEGQWHDFSRAALNRVSANKEPEAMGKVTGIGGVFLKSKGDAKALSAWYREHLGLSLEDFGGSILQWEEDKAEDKGMTVWHVAESTSEWFSPSDSTFMINYRVDDLEAMLEQFRSSGVEILQGPEYHENGVFAWIMDPDGNKVELWEPKIWDDANKK
jgi:predicted enzyme related to lactoylglutathione lyase